ncbi:MAG TPA: flavin reductase family protein [Rhodanobacter sp.]
MKTIDIAPRSMYYGTPVALIVTLNFDGTENIAPMSSSWSLRDRIVLGMGTASQTVTNLKRHPELSINFPDAPLWRHVEALSGLTGASNVPEHKAAQFRSEADKWNVAGFTRVPSARIRPGRIAECPLQMEAIVESLSSVEDEPEGFTVIVARVKAMHAHEDVVTSAPSAVDPDRWRPLIFSYRTYRSIDIEIGRMNRSVRS